MVKNHPLPMALTNGSRAATAAADSPQRVILLLAEMVLGCSGKISTTRALYAYNKTVHLAPMKNYRTRGTAGRTLNCTAHP